MSIDTCKNRGRRDRSARRARPDPPNIPVPCRRANPPAPPRSSNPWRRPTAAAAQAPVPQASVSPAPRSNTRNAMWLRSTICMNPRCAIWKARMALMLGPHAPPARFSHPPRAAPHADCPWTSALTASVFALDLQASMLARRSIARPRIEIGPPMSTDTKPSSRTRARTRAARASHDEVAAQFRRAGVEQGGDAARAIAALFDLAAVGIEDAVERAAAPHRAAIPASTPDRSPRLCAGRRARAASFRSRGASAAMAAASNTRKSLPKPCIFMNSMRMVGEHSRCGKNPLGGCAMRA